MADVFSQIHIQIVFAVQNRRALIDPEWKEELNRYLTGVLQNRGHKMLAIGGTADHIHIFFGLNPADAISDLVREMKKASSWYIRAKRLSTYPFSWQSGYGAFSYHRTSVHSVCKYILNQEEHHRAKSFKEEFHQLLEEYAMDLGKKEVFQFF